MTRSRLPLVSNNQILGSEGAEDQPVPVVVGTDTWYTWLKDQQIQSFSFRHPLGTFTVRRERKRQGWYWYAYRKHAGRLCKAYLGKTEELSLERLNAVAAALSSQGDRGDSPQTQLDEPERGTQQIYPQTVNDKDIFPLTPTAAFTYPTEPGQAISHNLPAQLTSLIGREQEVTTACALLRQSEVRLLSLTGTGGVGKTRLGLQIATELVKDFVDGICFVSLAPISDPELVISTIGQTLGLSERGDQPCLERLADHLQKKHLLLFLDNFEQVICAAPTLTELLGRCPSLKILVTSREVLRIRGEKEFSVLPLALPNILHLPEPEAIAQFAAVALFLQRARSFKPDFQITTGNAKSIAVICSYLDGLPLALELAAARLKLLSPQALLTRLEHRLQVLTQGPRDAHTRQQTLRNTLQWSYDLLNTEEQLLFRRLAVFVGGCTLEAVEAVSQMLGDEMIDVFDRMASLLDKSLVQQESAQREEQPRLMMLETIREYGLECLNKSGELEITRRAHADYFLALAEEIEPKLGDPEMAEWLERLEREHDNLRAALRWSLEQGDAGNRIVLALRLGGALTLFWILHGHFSEGRIFLERALAGSQSVMITVRAKALEAATFLALNQGDLDWATMLSEENLALSRELGYTAGIARILSQMGFVAMMKGDLDAACSLGEEAVSLARETGDKCFIADKLHDLAFVSLERGEYARACAMYEECLAVFRDMDHKTGIAASLHQLALTLFLSLGDHERIRSLLDESFEIWKEIGSPNGIAVWSYLAGQVALYQGDAAQAHTLLEESVTLYKEMGDRWHTARSLSGLAKVEAIQGNYAVACTLYKENLALCRQMGSKNIAPALEGLADVAVRQGQPAWAARLWGAAETLREGIWAPFPPVERADYERAVAGARASLVEQAFTALWAEGRTMPLEHILANRNLTQLPQQAPITPYPITVVSPPSHVGLTPREMGVLHLLAQGLTSAQIAEQLIIGLVTVNSHIRSIYSKLGVSSRSAATRYAVEHHLV